MSGKGGATPSTRGVVAVAVLDGFYGCGSGAGWSNRALIEILAEVLPVDVDLVVLPVRVDSVSGGWQEEWRGAVEEPLGRSVRRVEVRALDGNHGGPEWPGEPVLTGAVEREVTRLRGVYRRGLVVLCDVGFAGAAARSTADSAWTTVIVPRTSALLVQPELQERVAWECESLRRAAEMGVRIAAISGYMRSHLTEQIGVPASAVVDLRNGVSGVDAEPKAAGVADLPPAARGGFWLAMGRAVPEKGFDDLVDALCLLRDRGVRAPHVVLAAVGEGVDLSPYQRRLAGRVARERLDVSLLTRFSPQVRGLLAHRSIVGVIVPSRVEPFGRIPLEAYAAGAAPVVATRAGGLAELVVDGGSGYLAEPHDPADLAQALRRAAMADADTRARMRGYGREILRGFDYRDSVRSLLGQVAPWLTPAGRLSVRVGAAAGRPIGDRGVAVVQVPEVCSWNPYVAAAEAALAAQGVRVVRPGMCRDVYGPAARPLRQPVEVDAATIVHLHWPEKLAHQLGVDAATAALRGLVDRGAKIVQTVHNVRPHETTPELAEFLRWVDALTVGAHFFSADHEAQARSARPGLPQRVLHLPHPRFALPTPPTGSVVAGSVGLLGRLRGYKRTVGFARAYLQALGAQARLVVAGHIDEPEIHRGLTELALEYPGLDYRPGFVPEEGFWRLLGEVEWVALPYRRLYSSGVLVAALQLGRRIISPVPTGGTGLYGTGLDQWRTVQPWDDTRAVEELLAARAHVPPVGELALPSWPEAAEAMAGFYARLVEDNATPAARLTRTGSAAPTGRTPVPVHARSTDGEVFDFGTHANDFLVRREESLATETFLVRVPGGGAVPEHVHTDMEQTFVFVSGVGEATLSRDGQQARRFCCVPGDVVFVPAGWRHTVLAQSVEGLVYLTVNSFVPGVDRVGASAVAHAVAVQPSFLATGRAPRAAQAEPLAVFRSAETAFRVDEGGRRMWPRDFTALDTTLRRDPDTYRVRRLGPFEYVKSVTARPRILTAELALVRGVSTPQKQRPPYAPEMDIEAAAAAPAELRRLMVDRLRRNRLVSIAAVEAAMRAVPRHLFVPDATVERAYSDENIVTHRDADGVAVSSASAPGVVASMLEQLDVQPGHRVLEIGAGTGYNAALLAHLVGPAGEVTTVDIDRDVVRGGRECLAAAGYRGVSVFCGDGEFGYADHAPYDRIVITAGAWDLPPAWVDQLAPGGRLVVPLRMRGLTRSIAFEREDGYWRSRWIEECGFIPLRGAGGVAERNIHLGSDSGVILRIDDGQPADEKALGTALDHPPTLLSTGVTVSVTGHLDFWLAGMDGFCRLLAGSQAVDRGLVAPAFGWGSMGVFDQGTFAYLTLSPTGETDGSRWPRYELGVCAYGPGSGELANRVADRILAWEHDRQSMTELWIEVHPADTGDELSGQVDIRKRHTRVIVRTALLADDLSGS